MTYLSRRTREIRDEDAVPTSARDANRRGDVVRLMGHLVDPITAWRIGAWPVVETVNYLGRGG